MTDEECRRYYLWHGLWDEMVRLKQAYAPNPVPVDTWAQLERLCIEAASAIHTNPACPNQ